MEQQKNKSMNHFINNIKIIQLSNLSENSFTARDIDNTFIIFHSLNKILYIIYSTKIKSIISYNLNKFQIISEIKNAHEGNFITNFRHFFDKINNRDLIMSISAKVCNIKIWDNKNWNCILSIKDIYSKGIINSACFILYEKRILIVTGNNYWCSPNPIKIINIQGKVIKTMKNSCENSYYIDSYFDKLNFNLYIISCSFDYIISYDYIKNEKYHKYFDCNSKYHCSYKMMEKEGITKLIESAADGYIRIWNFHSGLLI